VFFKLKVGLAQVLTLSLLSSVLISAQRPAVPAMKHAPERTEPRVANNVAERQSQIVSVVRRLSGPRVLALLRQNGDQVEPASDDLLFRESAITNVTAGFYLGDSGIIAVKLSRPETEVYSWAFPAVKPQIPVRPSMSGGMEQSKLQIAQTEASEPSTVFPAAGNVLTVINKYGAQFQGTFVGIDGGTGLSFISVAGFKFQRANDISENLLVEGKHVRLVSPRESDTKAEGKAESDLVRLRMVETGATLKKLVRGSNGNITAITIEASEVSQASVGGIVVSESGQTIGLVDSVQPNEIRVIPAAVVRNAASRVLARTTASSRPWLGIRGEALFGDSRAKLQEYGWSRDLAQDVSTRYRGILLTSIVPGTPAFDAKLKPGDVLVSLNGNVINSNDDLSAFLSQASANTPILIDLVRPSTPTPFSISLSPSQVPDPVEATIHAEQRAAALVKKSWFGAIGLETVRLSEHVASRLGAKGGLFVLSVQPDSEASRAGLRNEDIIETIDGKPATETKTESPAGTGPFTLEVVREMKHLTVTVKLAADWP